MPRPPLKLALAIAAGLTIAGVLPASVGATYHEMKIRAVFKGPTDASFVELQMTAAGQNFTAGKHLTFYDHTGLLTHTSPPLADVANGENQRTILIADTGQVTTPDLTYGTLYQNFSEDISGGAVCYENIDCFAWGPSFTGGASLPSPVGTAVSGLSTNQVLARNITANCPTLLENADDTNNVAADFNFVIGFPVRNNAGAPTEVPCPVTPAIGATFNLKAAIKKCKKKFPKGPKRKKCIKKAKRKAGL
jgi:hypothetical protein